MILQLDDALDDGREMFIFQDLHFSGQGIGTIAGFDLDARLENGLTVVILLVYIMDRDPRLPIRSGDDRFVHKPAVHALATMFWQQGRMDIDDPSGIGFDQRLRYLPKEPRQDDIIDLFFPQLRNIGRTPEKGFLFDQHCRYPLLGSNAQHPCTRFVADDKTDFYNRMIAEAIDDIFGVRTRSRSEDRELCHVQNYGGQGNYKRYFVW